MLRGRFAGRSRTALHLVYAATARSAQTDRQPDILRTRHLWQTVINRPIEARNIGRFRTADLHPLAQG